MRLSLFVLAFAGCSLPVIHTGPDDAGDAADAGNASAPLAEGAVCERNDDCASGLCAAPPVVDTPPQAHLCAPNECPDGGGCGEGLACGKVACGTRCFPPVDAGGSCESGSAFEDTCEILKPCAGAATCVVEGTDTEITYGTCIAPGTSPIGGDCASDTDCAAGLFCGGRACTNCDDAHPCADGFVCGNTCGFLVYSMCAPAAGVGEACVACSGQVDFPEPTCAAGLTCGGPCDAGPSCCQ